MADKAAAWLMILVRAMLALLILLAGAGILWLLLANGHPVGTLHSVDVRQVPVFATRAVAVQRQWHGYGTAQAMDSADVPAQVAATVMHIPADVLAGRPVSKGQLLVQLDPSDQRHQVQIARQKLADLDAQLASIEIQRQNLTERLALDDENLALARDELERVARITASGAGSPQGLDQARRVLIDAKLNRLDTAQVLERLDPLRAQVQAQREGQYAALQLAQKNLARCRIESPLAGVLQGVDVEVGEQLGAAQRVARVVNLQRMEVALRLPTSARGRVLVNDQAQLHAGTGPGCTWNAKVSRISPEDDSLTRTLTVYVEVYQAGVLEPGASDDSKVLLTPGRFVSGLVTETVEQERWVLPVRALRSGRIFVVKDGGEIESRAVKVDFLVEQKFPSLGLDDQQWAVLDKLDARVVEGELVLVNGSSSVFAGDVVKPILPEVIATGPNALGKEAPP